MRTDLPTVIRLADYKVPTHLIDTVHLDVTLDGERTRVHARMNIRPNPASPHAPLFLDGDELSLQSIALDDMPLAPSHYVLDEKGLTLTDPPKRPFILDIVTRLDPEKNTKLMGLYRSSGNYCTQCEAEGFRRITFFPDRPDVMAVFTTRITALKSEAPVLLGNGNKVEEGELKDGWHYAVWHDPHKKPAYLFALVGGQLGKVGGHFTTRSGRKVELGVYVERGKENRASYAMDALIRSMKWDETAFGCEYDLDVFNIVAVSDFNMGAMENKGLNIFNDKYVLASPESATDTDYLNIEAIIAHEYFHNWTGNRITCRDWFQLCLKEGLTVFRDQEFTSDERSRAVKRISDVRNLRAAQFVEDSGPLAHPVRPAQYREINNFYTPTIYEKGAELIRMLKILIGPEDFRKGMDLYLTRCDGTAATIEEFIACFAETSGRDLAHFSRWYNQAGTPRVTVKDHYDSSTNTYRLTFTQKTPPTPGQSEKSPVVIPIALAFFSASGAPMSINASEGTITNGVFVLDRETAELVFTSVSEKPVASLLRGFSAPVILEKDWSAEDMLVLLGHDTDPFNRWQAAQTYATHLMTEAVRAIRSGRAVEYDPRFADALINVLKGDDYAFIAQVLALPTESDIAREIGSDIDPDAILLARKGLRAFIGHRLGDTLLTLRENLASRESYSPDAKSAGRRALANAALDLAASGHPDKALPLAERQFRDADNMTDRMAALSILAQHAGEARERALTQFAEEFRDDPLVLDKWFSLQAMIPEASTLDRVHSLMTHPAFSLKNPNRLRALVGAFASSNPSQFHRADGAGYRFLSEMVIALDKTNPQVAARLLGAFKTWRSLEAKRQALAEQALEQIRQSGNLSPDVADIVGRALAKS